MNPSTWRTVFLVAVGVFVLWLAYLARAVVTPLLVALLLAYILDPVVRALERLHLSRPLARGLVVVAALAALVTVVAVAATQFAAEASKFYEDVVGEPYVPALSTDRREFNRANGLESGSPEDRAAAAAHVRETTWDNVPIVYYDA